MNLEEAQNKLQEIGDGAESSEQVRARVEALTPEEKMSVLFPIYIDDYRELSSRWSMHLIDYLDAFDILNDYETGTSRREVLTGFLLTITELLRQSAEHQCRQELQTQTAATQFGMSISQALSSQAQKLGEVTDNIRTLDAYYSAVLKGRRDNYHYTDRDGNGVSYSRKELQEQQKFIEKSEREYRADIHAERKIHSDNYWNRGQLPALEDNQEAVQCVIPLWHAGYMTLQEEEEKEPALAGSSGLGFR